MTLKRGHLSWGVAVLLAFATVATAEPSAGEQVSRESESVGLIRHGNVTEECVEPAIKTVFGGPNASHCDNLFLVETLLPHAPMPVDGFVLYAEVSSK